MRRKKSQFFLLKLTGRQKQKICYIINIYLKTFFNKKITLVYDMDRSHCNKVVIEYMREWNNNPYNSCESYIGFDNPCLRSIYQPPGVIYNRP